MSFPKRPKTAQNDPLIVMRDSKFANNKLRRKYYPSFLMRLVARLLLIPRGENTEEGLCRKSMSDFLVPITKQVRPIRRCCSESMCQRRGDRNELKHPSVAIKLGFDISRLASWKLAHCIKIGNQKQRNDAQDFQQLMKIQWSVKVTKLATIVLHQHRFSSKKSLPHPNDIACLANFLTWELET